MTTEWHRQPMVAFDLETTGPHPDTARIVTATLIEVNSSGIGNVYEWLVNPGIDIPAGATAVHGISTERAREDGQHPALAVEQIIDKINAHMSRGTPVVAFNAAYDFTVLDRESRRHSTGTAPGHLQAEPVVDPHVVDKFVDRYRRGKRTLSATCEVYGVTLNDAHTSTADALAAARLAWRLAETYPELQIPLPELHARQQVWRADQAASLQDYFRKTDPAAVVNGDWPIQALPDGWTPELVDIGYAIAAGQKEDS